MSHKSKAKANDANSNASGNLYLLRKLKGKQHGFHKDHSRGSGYGSYGSCPSWGTRCICRNDKYRRTFPGIQSVCDDMDDWRSSKCNIFGRNCDYCTYPGTKGDAPGIIPGDSYSIRRMSDWCSDQEGSNGRLTFRGKLECRSVNVMDHFRGGDAVLLDAKAHPDVMGSEDRTPGFSLTVLPLSNGAPSTEHQCRHLTIHSVVSTAEELTVRLPGCNLDAVNTDQVKVDCNTRRCLAEGLGRLASAFQRLCDLYEGRTDSTAFSV